MDTRPSSSTALRTFLEIGWPLAAGILAALLFLPPSNAKPSGSVSSPTVLAGAWTQVGWSERPGTALLTNYGLPLELELPRATWPFGMLENEIRSDVVEVRARALCAFKPDYPATRWCYETTLIDKRLYLCSMFCMVFERAHASGA